MGKKSRAERIGKKVGGGVVFTLVNRKEKVPFEKKEQKRKVGGTTLLCVKKGSESPGGIFTSGWRLGCASGAVKRRRLGGKGRTDFFSQGRPADLTKD